MKKLLILVVMVLPAWSEAQDQAHSEPMADNGAHSSVQDDSLTTRRKVASTSIYQNRTKLSPAAVMALYHDNRAARNSYRRARILQPVGPVVSAAGITLGYLAIKGKPASADIHYNQRDTTVHYIVRSRIKLVAGLGLFVGGMALLELSNDLMMRSAARFNLARRDSRPTALKPVFHFGITPSGNLGLFASF